MRACFPHNYGQSGTTMPVCERVEAYNERSLCVKYHDQGVQTSFNESTPSDHGPMGNRISPVAPEDPGNARANIPDASKEQDHSNTSGYSRVAFKHIPGTQSVWRVASSNRFKTTEPHIYAPHFHMHTISSVLRTIKRGDYAFQKRFEGCVLPCTNTSRQQEVPTFGLRKQGISVPSTSLRSEHCPSGIYSSGAHSGSLPPSSGVIGNSISQRLVNTHFPDCQALLCHQSQLLNTLGLVGLKLNKAKSELDPVQDILFLRPRLRLDQGRASLLRSKAQEIIACKKSVPVHGITQLGFRSHSTWVVYT